MRMAGTRGMRSSPQRATRFGACTNLRPRTEIRRQRLPLAVSPRWKSSSDVVRGVVASSVKGNGGVERDLSAKAISTGVGGPDAGFGFYQWTSGSKFDKEILKIAVPTFLSSLMFPLATSVDTAIVGSLGLSQLSGVGLAGLLVAIIQGMFAFLGQLSTPSVAQANARGDMKEVSKITVKSVWLALGIGLSLGVGLHLGAEFIVQSILRPAAAVQPYAVAYMKTLSFATPAALLSIAFSGVLRGVGDAKSTLFGTIASSVVNLGLDCLFVFGLGWGVVGAGIATVASVYASVAYMATKLCKAGHLKLSHMLNLFETKGLMSYFLKGGLLSVRSLVAYGMIMVATVFMSRIGPVDSSAFEICKNLAVLSMSAYMSFEASAQSLCAKYLGLNQVENAKAIYRRITQIAVAFSVLVGLVLFMACSPIASLYTSNALVAAKVISCCPILFICLPIDACVLITDGALFAAKQSNYCAISMIMTTALGILTLCFCWNANILTVPLSWAIMKSSYLARGFLGFHRMFISEKSPYHGVSVRAAAS